MAQVIALDVGGTRSRAALFDSDAIVWRDSVPTRGQDGPDAMVESMMKLLAPLHAVAAPIGAGIAARVVNGRVTAHNETVLRGWSGYPLAERLEARLGRPVRVVNDARAAAWAEYRLGTGRGCSEFMFVTVSTGVGAGLVLDGRLHLARNGLDAELGDTLCEDGVTLEDHASGAALSRRAVSLGFADAKALCDAAEAGDMRADAVWRDAARRIAGKLADLSVLLGIQRTAVGGSVGLRPGTLARLADEMQRRPALYRHEIVHAALGADAGLHGAALLASDASADTA